MKDSINWFMQKCASSKGNTLWTKMKSGFQHLNNGIPLPERPKQPPKWGGQNEEGAFPDFPRIGDRPNKDPTGPGDDDEWKSWKEYEEEQRYKQWREWREKRKRRERPNRFDPFLPDPSRPRPSQIGIEEFLRPTLRPPRYDPRLNPAIYGDEPIPPRFRPENPFYLIHPTRPAIHFDDTHPWATNMSF